jgi:hypothetical protein
VSNTESSIPIVGLLGLLFIILKLIHVIDWSWWWVLAPFWIPLAIGILVFSVIVVMAGFKGWK